jgi:hypothetical protein
MFSVFLIKAEKAGAKLKSVTIFQYPRCGDCDFIHEAAIGASEIDEPKMRSFATNGRVLSRHTGVIQTNPSFFAASD